MGRDQHDTGNVVGTSYSAQRSSVLNIFFPFTAHISKSVQVRTAIE